jgi:hypothetical protein
MPNSDEMKDKGAQAAQQMKEKAEQARQKAGPMMDQAKEKAGPMMDQAKKKIPRDENGKFDTDEAKQKGADAVNKVKGLFKKD